MFSICLGFGLIDVIKCEFMVTSILVLVYSIRHYKRVIGIIEILRRTSFLKTLLNVKYLKPVSILTPGIENIRVQFTIKVIYAISVQKDMQKRILKTNAQIAHLAS